mgnify:CR=1 FL=1
MNLQSVNMFGYSNTYLTYQRQFTRYTTLNEGETRPPQWLNYLDDYNQNEARVTVLSNWIFKLDNDNTIKFKNLFNQIGENETIIRNGNNFLQRGEDKVLKAIDAYNLFFKTEDFDPQQHLLTRTL